MILSKSYKEIMDKIYVDDAMKQRILQNIEQAQAEQTEQTGKTDIKAGDSSDSDNRQDIFHHRVFSYKRLSVCAAAILLIFCFTSYFGISGISTIFNTGGTHQSNVASDNKKDSETEENTGMMSMDTVPGINQYSSAKELSEEMGFTISDIPSSLIPFKITETVYSDYGDGLAEIEYNGGKKQNVVYRKQSLPNEEDISGDYTGYSDVITVKIQSINVRLSGEQGKYNLATWSKGNYSYSLDFSDELTEKNFKTILKSIM